MITESKTFQPIKHSVGAARDFARDILTRNGNHHEDALLVVSELATNAVRHAQTVFTVTVRADGSGIEIGVSDNSRSLLVTSRTGDQTDGYGLVIIDRVSRDWGVEQSPDGKRVWVRLEYRA